MNDSNTFDSASNALFWGVDVASKKLDVARHDRAEVVSLENSPAGIEQFVAEVQRQPSALIVVEATGGYELPLRTALAEARLPVLVLGEIGGAAAWVDGDRLVAKHAH